MSSKDSEPDSSRLLVEDELACIECGAICDYFPMVVHGFDRCPECHIEHERQRVRSVFGTTITVEAMLSVETQECDTEEREIVTDGGHDKPARRREERRRIGEHPHVDGITRGTVLEYDGWQWAVVTEIAADHEPSRIGFVLVDELDDSIVTSLESAWGCAEHYDAVQPYRDSDHEYWSDVKFIRTDDIWTTLGPIHPDERTTTEVTDGE